MLYRLLLVCLVVVSLVGCVTVNTSDTVYVFGNTTYAKYSGNECKIGDLK